MSTRLDDDTRIGSIPPLAVLPAWQKKGIGKRLMDHALEYMRSMGMEYARIETIEENSVAMGFYPDIGFKEITRQNHYIMPFQAGTASPLYSSFFFSRPIREALTPACLAVPMCSLS